MILFTEFIESPKDRYDHGYKLLYFVAAVLFVNFAILIFSIIMAVYDGIRKALLKRKYKKMMTAHEKYKLEQSRLFPFERDTPVKTVVKTKRTLV